MEIYVWQSGGSIYVWQSGGSIFAGYISTISVYLISFNVLNRIGGVMLGVLGSTVSDRGFEPRSGQTAHH